ncbi:mas-related G-protein coupled receptor member H-like isoform X1 [Paroedura picta]|uniref:mas-related G-protein coupled receptor member H-like isoform X1 n=1 Tax=Paroedura picta TaxID=143630 RepID=UPI004057B550
MCLRRCHHHFCCLLWKAMLRSTSQNASQPESMEHQNDVISKLKNILEHCLWDRKAYQIPAYPTINEHTDVQLNRVDSPPSAIFGSLTHSIICSFTLVFCLFGLAGNGTVIWLLGFHLKRNRFTTYILNLAVVDLGVLFSLLNVIIVGAIVFLYKDCQASLVLLTFLELFFFMYSVSQFLLAAISIDRCASVLFPLWHRCRRPSKLSSVVCALIWGLFFLLSAAHFSLYLTQNSENSHRLYQLLIHALLCTLLMLLSALILLIKVCCKSNQHQRGKLLTSILIVLLVFLFLAFPLDISYIFTYYHGLHPSLIGMGFLCTSLNSSVNPVIYFLVGRKRKGKSRVSVKVALQVVLKGEGDNMEEQMSTGLQTDLQ